MSHAELMTTPTPKARTQISSSPGSPSLLEGRLWKCLHPPLSRFTPTLCQNCVRTTTSVVSEFAATVLFLDFKARSASAETPCIDSTNHRLNDDDTCLAAVSSMDSGGSAWYNFLLDLASTRLIQGLEFSSIGWLAGWWLPSRVG